MRRVRNGFTLVELLIVIVVIGVLASMLIVEAAEMESTSKATQIVNNLKQLQTAAMSWYWDHEGLLVLSDTDGYTVGGVIGQYLHERVKKDDMEIKRYLANRNFSLNRGASGYGDVTKQGLYAAVDGYSVYVGKSNSEYYVFYRISSDPKKSDKSRLREKLKGRAKSARLITYANQKTSPYNGENIVGMVVMTFRQQ